MSANQLKEYFRKILEEDSNIKEHRRKIEQMKQKSASLGIPRIITAPKGERAKFPSGLCVFLFFIMPVLVALVSYFVITKKINEQSFNEDPDVVLLKIIAYGVLATVLIAVIIPICVKAFRQSKLDKKYKQLYDQYMGKIKADEERVKKELEEQAKLNADIDAEEIKIAEESKNLRDLCDKAEIHESYRNVDAIKKFYNYFDIGKTYSLTFDAATGDIGAYNIYDNESLMYAIQSSVKYAEKSIYTMSEAIYDVNSELVDIHMTMARYYDKSLSYQNETLKSSQRSEVMAAKAASDAESIRRNTAGILYETENTRRSVDSIRYE